VRLVIREYLSMLRESGELDALLPDLLFSMDIEPISKPQVGARQHGVDIAGVGPDPDDNGTRKLFLLVVKQGDLDRRSWDSGEQAVRQSLNEILDVYLPQHVGREHESLPKKIVVCSNGDIKQNVERNWQGYKDEHTEPGIREYDFWGGDKLALLVERHFLDEYLFPESAQKQMRKTIALADQNEEDPHHFYSLIYDTLFERDLPTGSTLSARRKRQRALRLLNLSLNIVFHWCREADNLRPALLCAERNVLQTWDWMRQGDLFDCQTTSKEFARLFTTYLNVTIAYADKLIPLCLVRDGLSEQGVDELEYSLYTFETIGILGVLATASRALTEGAQSSEDQQKAAQMQRGYAQLLVALINNNPPAATPRFDGHAIDIALGLLALTGAGLDSQAAGWVDALSAHVLWAYRLGRHFPIYTDSYDDLVAMRLGQAPPKEKLMELSTLLPMLAHWYAVLDMTSAYAAYREAIVEAFLETDLQLWFPDESTEDHLYRENAGFTSGATLSSIQLPATLGGLKAHIVHLHEERRAFEELSCFTQEWRILGLIASRHYRTPVIPAYWQEAVQELPKSSEHNITSVPKLIVRTEPASANLYNLKIYLGNTHIGDYERSIERTIDRKRIEVERSADFLISSYKKYGKFVVRWNSRDRVKEIRMYQEGSSDPGRQAQCLDVIPREYWET